MKDQFTNTNREDEIIAQKLNQVAEQINISQQFGEDLEQKLREAYEPRKVRFSFFNNRLITSLGWIALLLLIGFVLDWSIRNLVRTTPGMGNGTPGFTCPITRAIGAGPRMPPGTPTIEIRKIRRRQGNIWTLVPSDGKIHMLPENQLPNGWLATNWRWGQAPGTDNYLTIEGRRLDAAAEAMIGDISDRFGNSVSSTLIFPTTGCWEITARSGEDSLTIVVEVVFDAETAYPGPVTPIITPMLYSTPVPEDTGYDWRGTKLYLAQSLPELPTEANVYQLQPDQHATVEEARALAQRFDLGGEIYQSPNTTPGITSYFFTDGKQSLSVSSNLFFTYVADMAKAHNFSGTAANPNAESIIENFLSSHGFNFPHRIEPTELYGGYVVEPLSPDGFPMRYEFYSSRPMLVTLDENGQVLRLNANLMNHQSVDAQKYDIIGAEEAFQKILDEYNATGLLEGLHSISKPTQEWRRAYPVNQPITIYGYISSIPALDSSQPPFVQIDGHTVTGNTNGIDALEQNTFVEATGKFIIENGIEKFDIESWKPSEFQQDGLVGTLQRKNGQVFLVTTEQEELTLDPDVPADLPMPFENAFVVGVRKGNVYEWTLIDDRTAAGGGGGGGGGLGFYKLNLSRTPVPFINETPTLSPNSTAPAANQGTVQYVVQEGDTLLSIAQAFWTTPERISQVNGFPSGEVLKPGMTIIIPDIPGVLAGLAPLGKRIEGLRGIVSITIYKNPDGSQRTEYTLVYIPADKQYSYMSFQMLLEGADLQVLQAYQNRPIEIWGTISGYNTQNLLPIVNVERFDIPFPDLNFQILKGTQRAATINGQDVVLFTTEEGTTYVQSDGVGDVHCCSIVGNEGDDVWVEALIVPGDAFSDYPLLRVFNWGSQSTEVRIISDQPYVMDEVLSSENYAAPTATIEKVELVYYTPDPRYPQSDSGTDPQYIQPAWRFYGHYSNGDEFEFLVQALKQEYLLPEVVPAIPPG